MTARRTLLGRFALDDQLEQDLERSGLLELWFTDTRPDATLVSDDGNRTVAWIQPSGAIAGVLVQDYAAGESRSIPFAFGTLEIVADAAEVAVFLVGRTPLTR